MHFDQLNRRAFLTLLGGAAAWPLAAGGQQSAMPVIGVLGSATAREWAPSVAAFLRGLSKAGFAEGRDIAIEYRWAENQYDRLPSLAAELIHRQVSVIAALTTCRFRKLHPIDSRASGESEQDRRMIAIGLLFVRMLRDYFKSRPQLEADYTIAMLESSFRKRQLLKCNRRNDEQINRRNPLHMIAKEGLPRLQWPISPRYHVDGNRGLRDRDAELEQFAMNLGSAPQRVLKTHCFGSARALLWRSVAGPQANGISIASSR